MGYGSLQEAVGERLSVSPDVHSIPYLGLANRGIRWVIFDIENTLEPIAPHGHKKVFRPETVAFLKGLGAMGLYFSFATNSTGDFSGMVTQMTGAGLYYARVTQPGPGKKPRKPWLEYYQQVIEKTGCQPDEAVMIGDKLMFDCVPAVRAGMHAVWIRRLGRDLTFAGIPVEAPRRWAEGLHRRRFGLPRP